MQKKTKIFFEQNCIVQEPAFKWDLIKLSETSTKFFQANWNILKIFSCFYAQN